MSEKLFLMCTHGPEDPERATIPFVLATAAQASEVEAIIGFQSNGVLLMRNDCAGHVFAAGFPPLSELLEAYLGAGGKLYVCGPCVQPRKIDSSEFIAGAEIVNAVTFVKQSTEATNVLVY
jgi:predicted peroxiredoxin